MNKLPISFFDTLSEFVCLTDFQSNQVVYINTALRKALGLSEQDCIAGRSYASLMEGHEDLCPQGNPDKLSIGQCVQLSYLNASGERYIVTETLVHHEGRLCRLSTTASPQIGVAHGVLARYIQNNYFDLDLCIQILSMPGISYFLCFGDMQTNTFYMSDAMRSTFGFESNIVPDLFTKWLARVSEPRDRAYIQQEMRNVLKQKLNQYNVRHRIRDKDNNSIWVYCNAMIRWNEARTEPLFFAGVITRQDYDFVVDPITNFPMDQAAISHLSLLRAEGIEFDVVGFSLNNFSEINHTLGRARADRLLHDLSARLIKKLGSHAQFFRLDGMRFMAVLTQGATEAAADVATAISKAAHSIYRQYGVMVKSPCSIGLLHYPDGSKSCTEFLDNIIALLSLAKRHPAEKFLTYSTANLEDHRARSQLALQLSKDVMNGCENFRVVVQPIVHAEDGTVAGGETLLRWRYQDKDISPGIFIPLLEDNQLILSIGKWVFEQTVRTISKAITFKPDYYLSFNVSYLQVMDDTFLPFLKQTLDKYQIDGHYFVMELTETHCDDVPEKLRYFINGCREMGMRVALDDFGSGYSSLALLLRYPASIVKLDRGLVIEATQHEDNVKFIESIVYACHQFGRMICAEGVEYDDELAIVRKAGCDLIQGFYFYRPQELSSLYQILQTQASR